MSFNPVADSAVPFYHEWPNIPIAGFAAA